MATQKSAQFGGNSEPPADVDTIRTTVAKMGVKVDNLDRDVGELKQDVEHQMTELKHRISKQSSRANRTSTLLFAKIDQTQVSIHEIDKKLAVRSGMELAITPIINAVVSAGVTGLMAIAIYKIFGAP